MASTRIIGLDVLVVDLKGKGLLKPQSPLASDDCGVMIDRCVGWGRVDVSDPNIAVDERSVAGLGRGGGIENILEALNRAPPGETLRAAIVPCVGSRFEVLLNRGAWGGPQLQFSSAALRTLISFLNVFQTY